MARRVGRSFRLPRLWSNQVLRRLAPLFEGEVLNVSGRDDRDKDGGRYRDYFSAATGYYVSNYPGEGGIDDDAGSTDFEVDLCAALDPELEGRFDVVLSHTTLEHIAETQAAMRTLCKLTRDTAIVVVPFAQQLHYKQSYGDYWRFTPMGLRHLFRQNGLEVVYEAANPDSNAGVYLLFVGSRQPDRWRSRLPAWQPVERLGNWIGDTAWRRWKRQLRRLLGR